MWTLLATGALGAVLGARHAFEPDHLAAVSTLVSDRPRPRHAAALGALWGLGHTAALLAVGLTLVATRTTLAPAAERGFELAVAAMLVVLGVRSVIQAVRDGRRGQVHAHTHGDRTHVHPGPRSHVHVWTRTIAVRPLVVGLIHGLAGSGGMAALAMAEMSTTSAAALYVLLFGVGSTVGMAAASAGAAASMTHLTVGAPAARRVRIGAGVLAVAVGLAWGALAIA
ncbi:MAG: hypothetical protein R3B06_08635 [Kofleriaceae bacterium]